MACICLSSTLERLSMSRSSAAIAAAYIRHCRARTTPSAISTSRAHISTTAPQPQPSPRARYQQQTLQLYRTSGAARRHLTPPIPPPYPHSSSATRTLATSTTTTTNADLSSTPPPPPPSRESEPTAAATVSSSGSNSTIVLRNPRTDDEGQPMQITISPRAAARLAQITNPSSPQHLRVTVESGGCHGFQYLMSLEESDKIDGEEDTVFAFSGSQMGSTGREGGGRSDGDGNSTGRNSTGAKVVMDESSLELLKGSTVDYTTELIGSQFKITGNPRAKSSCGCGTSFDVD